MFINSNFGKSLEILQRGMDVSVLRRQIIADNMANGDTPNFKRSTLSFESELKRALDSEGERSMEGALTNSRHISFNKPQDWRQVSPRKVLDYLSTTDNNGNNVDVEVESMNALQNQMNYSLMASAVTNQFNQISIALK
ncbi:MAG: flagellar basal body rod protein FlgB [Spirochaetales bacterium]|nr:flagellar basal body rod protein FlgB [Spirochaetales bacterium]